MSIVDAHVHLWDVDEVEVSWFTDSLALPRRVDLPELSSAVGREETRPEAAVAVQAADTLAEARWLTERAGGDSLVRRVVLQYEPAPGAWAGASLPLMDHPAVAGIRLAVPSRAADLSDVDGLEQLAAGLRERGQVLEVLVRPEQLGAVAELADRHAGLAVVVCHLGLGGGDPSAEWTGGLTRLARSPGVLAKVSGLIRDDDAARLREIVAEAFGRLGADRLMFGSDWPMSARLCPHPEVVRRTATALPVLGAAERESFWCGLAGRVYGL